MSGAPFLWLAAMLATAVPPEAALFPGATDVVRDGATLTLRTGPGATLTLMPVRYMPASGRSTPVGTRRCGVILRKAGGAATAVETIGIGNTETVTCGGLLAAGTVPPAGAVPRIALVYRVFSPNAVSRAPVILRLEMKTSRWRVDDALSQRLAEDLDTVSIPAIRKALARR